MRLHRPDDVGAMPAPCPAGYASRQPRRSMTVHQVQGYACCGPCAARRRLAAGSSRHARLVRPLGVFNVAYPLFIMTIPSLQIEDFNSIEMDFSSVAWRRDIPPRAGWYAIETNAPIAALAQVPLPLDLGLHYPIAQRIRDSQLLIENGDAILPRGDGASYIVYSGEHGDLKARARQHVLAHTGTGCLALARYEIATKFKWKFHYRLCEVHVPGSGQNKVLRNYLEQKWRAENGWPVLCAR